MQTQISIRANRIKTHPLRLLSQWPQWSETNPCNLSLAQRIMLMQFDLKSSLLAILLALSCITACGEDHRTEDFCNLLCECTSADDPEGAAQCNASCFASFDAIEEATGSSPITDACYACLNNTSCQLVQSGCADDCASLGNTLNQPEPPQGDTN